MVPVDPGTVPGVVVMLMPWRLGSRPDKLLIREHLSEVGSFLYVLAFKVRCDNSRAALCSYLEFHCVFWDGRGRKKLGLYVVCLKEASDTLGRNNAQP